MGYGPCAKNRFGYCWRNDHGQGIRMTPYFKNEDDVNKFHEYFEKNYMKYNVASIVESYGLKKEPDLRVFAMKEIIKIAFDFARDNNISDVVHNPIGETQEEFYGTSIYDN